MSRSRRAGGMLLGESANAIHGRTTESMADSMMRQATNIFWLRGTSRDIFLVDMMPVLPIPKEK
jgi:hypothetical protein